MKLRETFIYIALAMAAVVALGVSISGCGSKGANVVTVAVACGPTTVLVTKTATCAANVSGSSNTKVAWSCTYTTTTGGTTSQPSPCTDPPQSPMPTGNIPANSSDATVVFTAPGKVPVPLPTITITAKSDADPTKTGTATLNLDSGIRVSLNRATATVPTKSIKRFVASVVVPDASVSKDVTWLVTQQASSSTTPLPEATSCSPGCGTIDGGLYTAPDAVPSTPTVTLVVSSKADPSRFASATVTVVQGGPITFSGISPTTVAQGAFQQDIFLDAPNISDVSLIVIRDQSGAQVARLKEEEFKTVFPVPNSSPASQTSIGARFRLSAEHVKTAGTYQVSVDDPVWLPGGAPSFPLKVVPVRPSVIGTTPKTVTEQVPLTACAAPQSTDGCFIVNGGYFGKNPSLVTANLVNDLSLSSASTARQLFADTPHLIVAPGLYTLSVTSKAPNPPQTAVTNTSVFPDYGAQTGTDQPSLIPTPIAAGSVPSAIAIDSVLGVAVVTEAGANAVRFYTIGTGTLALLGTVPVGLTPTSVAVNETTHRAVVVNYGAKSLTVLDIPTRAVVGNPINLPSSISASPYSVGVDSDTNRGIVALSNTNIGLIVNLNTSGSDACIDTSQTLPCATASVTLGTGQYPQIAMEPGSHRAWVTPGGATPGTGGPLSVVDLAQANGTVAITRVSLNSKVVTVTTTTQHNLDPGNPGVVLISGVPLGANGTNFNGSFPVVVVDAIHFTYALDVPADRREDVVGNSNSIARFGRPNLTFNLSTSIRGIATNSITRTAALADPIASFNQINLINSLDQSISSISLGPSCYGGSSCSGETDTTYVAFQPNSNVLVSFNPVGNKVSFIYPDPGDPARLGRQFILPTGQTAIGSAGGLTISGALAVDPASNQAFVVNSGSSSHNITIVKLSANRKNVQLTRLVIPGGVLPQATLTSSQPLVGVQIFGSGLVTGAKVFLDGDDIAPRGGTITPIGTDGREIDATIPVFYLSAPHRFALDVLSGGVRSNATDFLVIKAVDLSGSCANSSPTGVAIDDARDIAVVTNSVCNTASIIDVNPGTITTPNVDVGKVIGTVGVGAAPAGVAVVPRYGFAVVANNGAGTASILDLRNPASPKQAVLDVTVGTSPNGVAINPENGQAIVANTGSNTISAIDLSLLLGSSPATSLTATSVAVDQQPIAVAIDPDRGTSGRGLAVVSAQQVGGSGSAGVLDVVDLGTSPPTKSTTAGTAFLTGALTGLAFDPTSTLFYATSSTGNVVTAFNPDSSRTINTPVGVNPTSLAFNPQTGALLTVNSGSNTISIVDMLSNPFRTRATLGISGSGQYGAAIHPRTNIAVIADPANKRVLLFPMP